MRFPSFTLGILIGAVLFTTASVIIAWTGPTSAPPAGNVDAPINVGTTDQVKNAGLGVNALAVFGNSILSGPSVTYLNFGGVAQEAGYGFRDNAGTMEFKNSGGSWSGILSASSTFSQIKFADGTTQTTAARVDGIATCPSGWSMIGKPGKTATFCVETNERSAAQWLSAQDACDAINDATLGEAHLCTYNEWYKACKKGTPSNMTNNYEWVAELHTSGSGSAKAAFVGSGGCGTINGDLITISNAFRCCLR